MKLRNMKLLRIITLSVIIISCYFSIFHLPFYFPPRQPSLNSMSYNYGFNNNAAILAILLFIGIFFFFRLKFEKKNQQESLESVFDANFPATRIPLRDFLILSCCYIFVIGSIYFIVDKTVVYVEASYFMRILERMLMGQRPYVDFEYAYGAGLIYPSYILCKMGMSPKASYFLVYTIMSMASVYLLGYIIERVNISVTSKRIIFYLLAIPAFPLLLGLNYIFLRFLAPYAGVLFLRGIFDAVFSTGRKLIAAVFYIICLLAANFLISPEIGIVFFLACALYIALLGVTKDKKFFGLLGIHALAVLYLFLFVPASYLMILFSFAGGSANWVILPTPSIIMYLASLFLIVPAVFKDYYGYRRSPLLVVLAALSVMMLPAVMGRCDPLHVFFSGFGVFLLTFAYGARYYPSFFKRYVIAFIIVFTIGLTFSSVYNYHENLVYQLKVSAVSSLNDEQLSVVAGLAGKTVQDIRARQLAQSSINARAFSETTAALGKYEYVATPFGSSPEIYRYLLLTHKYVPDYFRGMQDCNAAPQIAKKLAEFKNSDHNVLFLPVGTLYPEMRDDAGFRKWFSMVFLYPLHLKRIRDGAREVMLPLLEYIHSNYREVVRMNDYVVMERLPVSSEQIQQYN